MKTSILKEIGIVFAIAIVIVVGYHTADSYNSGLTVGFLCSWIHKLGFENIRKHQKTSTEN